jgi:acetyltransferase-like isoleucine patch superfamily enzyme
MTITRIVQKILNRVILKIGARLYEANDKIATATLPQFGNTPQNLHIALPRRFINPQRIFFGDNVSIGPGGFLYAFTQYPGASVKHPHFVLDYQYFEPVIRIGSRVSATGGLQIAAQREVIIEDDVMFASNVYINDAMHDYKDANTPYKYQKLHRIEPVVIGAGSWVGQNVVIMPGVTVGALSVIGANSVVTKSIPAQCVAVGSPARVIKQWNGETSAWVSQ